VSLDVDTIGRRFARLTTNVVVRRPALWRLFRKPLEAQFDRLAPSWEQRITPEGVRALERALDDVPPPTRVLDIGSGTGAATFLSARRFPEAEVVGIDLSERMVEQARAKTPPELAERVRFEVADASALPFGDDTFDLVTLLNAIPFFDELARVARHERGAIVAAFARGAATPIYVPDARLRHGLEPFGFAHFASFSAGESTAFLALRGDRT
jgi:SAM-dependent methyltransferase